MPSLCMRPTIQFDTPCSTLAKAFLVFHCLFFLAGHEVDGLVNYSIYDHLKPPHVPHVVSTVGASCNYVESIEQGNKVHEALLAWIGLELYPYQSQESWWVQTQRSPSSFASRSNSSIGPVLHPLDPKCLSIACSASVGS